MAIAETNFAKSKNWLSLAETCNKLGRARSTLMRLLPAWEGITSYKPRKDHSGRWFIPVKSVEALTDSPELYLKLAGRATGCSDELTSLRCENRTLKRENTKLRKLVSKWRDDPRG